MWPSSERERLEQLVERFRGRHCRHVVRLLPHGLGRGDKVPEVDRTYKVATAETGIVREFETIALDLAMRGSIQHDGTP